MKRICVFTLFDNKTGRPKSAGVKFNNKTIIKHLYCHPDKKSILSIENSIKEIRRLIVDASNLRIPLVISDFKSHLKQFDLPLYSSEYNIYDMHLDAVDIGDNGIQPVLDAMCSVELLPYQKIFANAAVVYEYFERNGVLSGYFPMFPKWLQTTFSGRSKTTGFNIQGATDDNIRGIGMAPSDVFIHFDWISADIRVASIMSGDKKLSSAFENSDPYTVTMNELNKDTTNTIITREEAKKYLLKSVNSMDIEGEALVQIYPDLGRWIRRSKMVIDDPAGYMSTLLGRRFRRKSSKNDLAVINGAMQGSVAHAMQLTIRRIWEQLGDRLIAEIHDSLIVSCPGDPRSIREMINKIVSIMLYPFDGVLENNPSFPLKVSVGSMWKKWVLLETHRASGVERA